MDKQKNYTKNIKEGLEEISKIKRLSVADLNSLVRWTAWVHRDAKELLKLKGKEYNG